MSRRYLRVAAPADDPAMRTCLRCGRRFDSRGPGNRLCRKCRDANQATIQTNRCEAHGAVHFDGKGEN